MAAHPVGVIFVELFMPEVVHEIFTVFSAGLLELTTGYVPVGL